MYTLITFICKSVFLIIVGAIVYSYILVADTSGGFFAPDKPHKIENKVNTAGGLIIPKSDPRFN